MDIVLIEESKPHSSRFSLGHCVTPKTLNHLRALELRESFDRCDQVIESRYDLTLEILPHSLLILSSSSIELCLPLDLSPCLSGYLDRLGVSHNSLQRLLNQLW